MNVKDITQAELMAHPLMSKVAKDIQETRIAQEIQRALDEREKQRLRAESGRIAHGVVETEVAKYEEFRTLMNTQLHRLWSAEQAYSRITGIPSGVFPEQTFLNINIPTLNPKAQWHSGFATTYTYVQAYMVSNGKNWN